MLMEKFKEPHPKKIERIDYEKNEANYEEQVNKSEENPSGVDETKKPADEIVGFSLLKQKRNNHLLFFLEQHCIGDYLWRIFNETRGRARNVKIK